MSALSEAMASLAEQNLGNHSNSNDDGTFKVSNSVSPSIEVISPKIPANTVGEDEYSESVATTGTNDTDGSKRKRRRQRKRSKNSNGNDENQMNLPNIETTATSILKNDVTTEVIEKPISKCNMHVR